MIQAIVKGCPNLRVGGFHIAFGDDTHARASGKVPPTHMDDHRLQLFGSSQKLARLTANTVRTPRELRAQQPRIAAQGNAIDREEFAKIICCVAEPVLVAEGKPVAALAICAPARGSAADETRLIKAVVRGGKQSSASLGFPPPAGSRPGSGVCGGFPVVAPVEGEGILAVGRAVRMMGAARGFHDSGTWASAGRPSPGRLPGGARTRGSLP